MKILLIDVGNTRLKYGYTNQHAEVGEVSVVSLDEDPTQQWQQHDRPDAVWISSVGSEKLNQLLASYFQEVWDIRPFFIRSPLQGNGIRNAYREPHRLGCDRWAAMVAAYQQAQQAVLVVDAGSALTLDAIDAQGQHLGGLITPGLGMAASTLLKNTQIQLQTGRALNIEPGWFADGTEQGIAKGALLGACALIENSLAYLRAQGHDAICYLTGGDAMQLKDQLQCASTYDEALVLKGLARMATQD